MMFLATPWPAYIVGTSCIGRGCFAISNPRPEYRRTGLALEGASASDPRSGLVSPLMLFKGIREVSYGLTIILLQRRGLDDALTLFALVLAGVRVADGVVVWWKGGEGLRHQSVGHFMAGAVMAFWGWRRGLLKDVLPLMHDLRAGGFNPPFSY
ncbi:hypothetical protein NLU13_6991 [Sarocladium strictum]|uniref:Uncharacterized protein n=1 Tax=Sarocladium strictum TaxID=5046 RepID=A0AA39GF49_SARSR|nr:hypothetical protein NLU13_6991 [Sarocladium strictum]